MYDEATKLQTIIENAQHIVVIQADNPDGDSLGSALALEHILGDMGKTITLFCAVDMPSYLQYLVGWDRVTRDMPRQFDASIIVDASTLTLLEKLAKSGELQWLSTKPCAVLDHHAIVENPVPFAAVTINDSSRAATGELVYMLAKQLDWPLTIAAQEPLLTAILGDTQGLTNQLASAQTYRIVADMIEAGLDRPAIEEKRREFSKMQQSIFRYKAALINHTEFSQDGRIATVVVPQVEINQYSPLYNPAALIQPDMLQTLDVDVAIVFKTYDDGHVTAAIRCNPATGVAAQLADKFGGGGHAFASGFKYQGSKPFNELKSECTAYAQELINQANGM